MPAIAGGWPLAKQKGGAVSCEILFAAHVLPIAKYRRTAPGPGHSGEPGGAPSAGQRAPANIGSDSTPRPTAIALGRASRSRRLAGDPDIHQVTWLTDNQSEAA